MRVALAVVAIVALPAVVGAQSGLPSISAPLPPIGLPLPQISYPLPPITLPPPTVTTPRPIRPRPENRHRQPVILYPAFGWYGYPYANLTPPPATSAAIDERREEPLSGTLLLYVEPQELLQVFIDGYYAGTPEDFNSGLEIIAGPHTIELSAPGYESIRFNVRIDPSRPITYRGKLKPLDPKPEGDIAPARTPVPTTLYYIPGCYLGNVDPKDVKLPANCDLSRLVTRKVR